MRGNREFGRRAQLLVAISLTMQVNQADLQTYTEHSLQKEYVHSCINSDRAARYASAIDARSRENKAIRVNRRFSKF
jgi:hypothetical protein